MTPEGKQRPRLIDRHHYVWQHYLRAWASNGRVACLRNGNIFFSTTNRLAIRRQFYHLKEITAFDIEFVRELAVRQASPIIQRANEGWIETFSTLIDLKRACEALGKNHEEFGHLAEEIVSNSEEMLHGAIEKSAIPHLKALRNKDLGLFSSIPDLASFLHFLAVQFMRTEKTRASFLPALSGVPGFNAENAWGLLRHIFATNISGSLFARHHHLGVTLLEAPKGSEFITSDQPVVNLKAFEKPAGEEVRELDLYYPISPDIALRISLNNTTGFARQQQLSGSELAEYNRKFIHFAAEQVFSSQRHVLEQLKASLR